jgi:ABC-type Fe3+-citrate transport system substrate-binding protein
MENKKQCLIGIMVITLLCGCANSKQTENDKQLQKVKKGMYTFKVEQIMGEPDKVVVFKSEPGAFRYMYMAPIGSSDNLYIIFSSVDSTVKSINYGN